MASLRSGIEGREQCQLVTPFHRPELSVSFHLDRCDRLGLLTKALMASVHFIERRLRQRSTLPQRSTHLPSPFHEASSSCSINACIAAAVSLAGPQCRGAAESTQVRVLWGPEKEGQEPYGSEVVCVQRRKEMGEAVWCGGVPRAARGKVGGDAPDGLSHRRRRPYECWAAEVRRHLEGVAEGESQGLGAIASDRPMVHSRLKDCPDSHVRLCHG